MEKPQLVITYDPETNQVAVSGPIKNRMLAYAMLKLGEKAIDEDYERDKAQNKIVPVRGNGNSFLRR